MTTPTAKPDWMTPEQWAAFEQLKTRWGGRVSDPRPMVMGAGAAMVECFYANGTGSVWVGIERDGHPHS